MKGLLFTYLLCYGGSIASLIKPWYGLLTYVCFAIIKPEVLWHWSVPKGNYSRIVAISLLIGWALNHFGNWNFGRARIVVHAALGYWVWCAVSAVQAANQDVAWPYVENLSKVMLPFLVGVTLVESPAQVRQILWAIALSIGYLAIELNRAYLDGYDVALDGFLGVDNNSIALMLTPGIGLGFFLAYNETRWILKLIGLVISLASAHVCMFSFSRGAMLAMVVTGAISFIVIPKSPKHYLGLALVILVCLRLMGKEVTEEFTSSFADGNVRDASAQSRVDLWRDCTDTMLKNPLTGVGPDHWPLIAHTYGWPRGKEAHSTWFQAAAELGIPGLGFLVAMYGALVCRLWAMRRVHRALSTDWQVNVANAVIASLIGFAVAISFVTAEGIEVPYYIVMAGAAALKVQMAAPDRNADYDTGVPEPLPDARTTAETFIASPDGYNDVVPR